MDNNVFEKVLGLSYQFRIQADVACSIIATPPLGFHALQKVTTHMHFELALPFLNETWNDGMQQRFVPLMNNLFAFFAVTAGTDCQNDPLMIQAHERLYVFVPDGEQMA